MTNLFLKVNKDLFKLGLNPTEILLVAQIMEFQANNKEFYMSDEALATNFGVSVSTISRELNKLNTKGFITKETKNIKGGRERKIVVNFNVIENELAKVDEEKQSSNCLLSNVNLLIDNRQNDLIKDNIKDNIKDKVIDYKTEALHSLTNSDGSFKM